MQLCAVSERCERCEIGRGAGRAKLHVPSCQHTAQHFLIFMPHHPDKAELQAQVKDMVEGFYRNPYPSPAEVPNSPWACKREAVSERSIRLLSQVCGARLLASP